MEKGSSSHLIGTVYNFGFGPVLIRDTEQADMFKEVLTVCSEHRVITDGDEFTFAMKELGLSPSNEPRRIYAGVFNSAFVYCMAGDWINIKD